MDLGRLTQIVGILVAGCFHDSPLALAAAAFLVFFGLYFRDVRFCFYRCYLI